MTNGPKQIWLGPLLGNNRAQLIERCSQLVAENRCESFLYIAASHPLLELVTRGILDGANNKGVWGELPVYLFRGFVRRVLSTSVNSDGLTVGPRLPIDREELPLKRGLISQILRQLNANKQFTAIRPLANRDGCVTTITTLMGEIQRAAKTPEQFQDIVARRVEDLGPSETMREKLRQSHTQIDFDRDVALIYSTYSRLLEENNLTESDADQLRALRLIRGEIAGSVPWLENVRVLVLDGFFDFTPVQGEIVRELVRQIPEVIVNLNSDAKNPTIFQPFRNTIEQLQSMADFELRSTDEMMPARGALANLRERLFKASDTTPLSSEAEETETGNDLRSQKEVRLFTCSDRETEIRKLAKEVKRLLVEEQYELADIALVVRERASYADTIARVMRDESIPCNIDPRINAIDIPAVRAARKLFDVLDDLARNEKADLRVCDLADLIKSEYFRIDDVELAQVSDVFERRFGFLITPDESLNGDTNRDEWRLKVRHSLGIGRWDPDSLENTIAFVGSSLSLTSWLDRSRKLLTNWPQVKATTDLVAQEPADAAADEETDQIEDADKVKTDDRGVEKKRRPSSEIHPAAIAWASLMLGRLADIIKTVAREGSARDLRASVMRLLDRLQFARETVRPTPNTRDDDDLGYALLDLNGLEALRRAFVAALKSIDITLPLAAPERQSEKTDLPTFLGEVVRALNVEVSIGNKADYGGLRVLEATDVRGLRFRAVFIAGLVEGGFPLRVTRDWIYPHEERERLKRDYGLTLEDISPATLLKEEHYFYQAACRATEKLYLSRVLLLEEGTETVASYYINELARAIRPYRLESEPVGPDFDGTKIFVASTVSELATSLVRQDERRRHKAGRSRLLPTEVIDVLWREATESGVLSPSVIRRISVERERASNRFGAFDGQITSPGLLRMLEKRFDSTYVHSASALSTFGNCPYRFFASRVLGLKPRGEAALDLQAIDAGKLLHDILRRFFERHRGERLIEYERESLRTELRDVADNVFTEHERNVPPLNPDIWKIDCEIRKIILDQVLLHELGVQEKTSEDVVAKYFEVGFGMRTIGDADPLSKAEQLELTRAISNGEESIRLQGQIDRIDEARDGTLIAYDYKLSTASSADDMKAGRSLQLPIYLEALERLILPGRRIAGGGYYILKAKPGRRNSGIYRKEFAGYLGLPNARNSILSDSEWHKLREEVIRKIWSFLDAMRVGDFRVRPSEDDKTCKFCDYSAVCRYEKYRIRGKLGNETK